jgi:hypothetical protein
MAQSIGDHLRGIAPDQPRHRLSTPARADGGPLQAAAPSGASAADAAALNAASTAAAG